MMEVPEWMSVSDPRSEAFHNIKDMRRHMVQYNDRLGKKQNVTPEEISILWAAYKSAGNTLDSAAVLGNLLKFCKTDQDLGLLLLKSQCDSQTCNIKEGYDEAIVGDALSLIKDVGVLEPCVITTLKRDGWFD